MNVNPRIKELTPYVPGKPPEELAREYGVEDAIKLASNENPRGPSERVREILRRTVGDLNRYPDGSGFKLKQLLADSLRIDATQITLGNGSNDVLELAARVALEPGSESIVDEHCFLVYPLAIKAAHGRQVTVKSVGWGHDLEGMLHAITPRTRLIYIANPNNPTGTGVSEKVLLNFLDRVRPDIWVVLDEAYFEYARQLDGWPDGVELCRNFPNLVVTRTFSKAYGLAGIRLGYAVSSAQFADYLNRIRQPFNANTLALEAAYTAYTDQDYIAESIAINTKEMQSLCTALDKLEIPYISSAGNFLTLELGAQANLIYDKLLHLGVIVRPLANYQMPGHLRVTVGTSDEISRFVQALKHCL